MENVHHFDAAFARRSVTAAQIARRRTGQSTNKLLVCALCEVFYVEVEELGGLRKYNISMLKSPSTGALRESGTYMFSLPYDSSAAFRRF